LNLYYIYERNNYINTHCNIKNNMHNKNNDDDDDNDDATNIYNNS